MCDGESYLFTGAAMGGLRKLNRGTGPMTWKGTAIGL